MKFSRDSWLWILAMLGSLMAYLTADGRNPLTWDYASWVKFGAAIVAVISAQMGGSPLKTKATLKLHHPHKVIVMLALMVGLAGSMGCAARSVTPQIIAASHDSLVTAQNLEAQLCWGVSDATAHVEERWHCTSPQAAALQLTDARHQAINAKLGQAIRIHYAATAAARTGAAIDAGSLEKVIQEILVLVGQLVPSPEVERLTNAVKKGSVR